MIDRVNDSGSQTPVSSQFFQKMVVLYDHYPVREMELAVRKGEKVEVVKREPDWLFVRNERGKEGYVPARNCFAPVTRRTRSNSRSSIPIRPVMSGEIIDQSPVGGKPRGGVPMYSSSSAGKVRRYDSPMSVGEYDRESFQRISSPSSSAFTSQYEHPSTDPSLDTKGSLSSSSGVSMMDHSSPALTRAFSQDELKPPHEDLSAGFSMSQDPNMTGGGGKSLMELSRPFHHKHSSSDDSGTVDSTHLQELEYASTIRNGGSSSEEGNLKLERVSSGGVTPSMKDRPLPSPPKPSEKSTTEDSPPPVPPRNASLETSRQRANAPKIVSEDDNNPYAQPVDSIINGKVGEKRVQSFHQDRSSRNIVDISERNSGVDSPYSEVYRPQRRPINVEGGRDSPSTTRRALNRNQRNAVPMVRRPSPLVNGTDYTNTEETQPDQQQQQSKGIMKFRKYLWGVFICMKVITFCYVLYFEGLLFIKVCFFL